MRIRPFEIEDVVWCAPLAEDLFADLDVGYGDAVARWAVDPMVCGWIAEDDEGPTGFVLAGSLGLVGEDRPHVLEVLAIGVRPGARRLGAGRSLLARVMREARVRPGVLEVRLVVAAENTAALALFRQAGFVVAREDDGTFPHGQRAMRLRWTPRDRTG